MILPDTTRIAIDSMKLEGKTDRQIIAFLSQRITDTDELEAVGKYLESHPLSQ